MVRTGVERAFGSQLRRTLARFSNGKARAATGGFGVALALQSAAATALLAMSFVASGALATGAGLAIMLGADLGSALAVQILSLDLTWVPQLLLVVGVILFLAFTERRTRQIGRTLIGLGLILLALGLIRTTSSDITQSATVVHLLGIMQAEYLLVFCLVAVLTWIAHSSVAMVLLIGSLASSGVLTLEFAFVAVLGANMGGGLIPLVLAWRRPREQQRIPLGNLLFRAIGSLALLGMVSPIARWAAELTIDTMQLVVMFHLGFNLLLVLLFLPTVDYVARMAERFLDARPLESLGPTPLDNPSHLNPKVTDQPQLALASALREVLSMADWVELMLRESLDAFQTDRTGGIKKLAAMDDRIDDMHSAIKHYLVQVSRNRLDESESQRCMEIAAFTMKLEHIGDIIEKNLLQIARKHVSASRQFSDDGWTELTELHTRVLENFQLALNVFVSGDVDSARQLVQEKQRFRDLQLRSNRRHMRRLRDGSVESIDTSPTHLDVIRDLSQINALLCAVAYPILEESGDLLASRLKETDDDELADIEDEMATVDDPVPTPGNLRAT